MFSSHAKKGSSIKTDFEPYSKANAARTLCISPLLSAFNFLSLSGINSNTVFISSKEGFKYNAEDLINFFDKNKKRLLAPFITVILFIKKKVKRKII